MTAKRQTTFPRDGRITIRLHGDTLRELRRQARKARRTLAHYARTVLEQHVEGRA